MISITNKRDFLTYLAIVGGILILANVTSRNLFFRWDWTENNIYTLSESSRNIVGQLDDRLLAKVYFSDNLPGQYANTRRYLQDLLEEFQAYSGGNFRFEIYRPEDDSKLESQAQKYGIPPIQLQVIENDRMEIKNVWMGLVLLYADRQQTIPMIQSTTRLEYDLASAVKKLTDVNKRTVAVVRQGEALHSNNNVEEMLRQTYNVTTATLAGPVPSDVDLLLMNGVTDSLASEELYHLDQYLMSGRPLFLAQGKVAAELQQGFATEIRSNLFGALDHYGLSIVPGLVADKFASKIGIETQRGIFRVRNAVVYPFFPLLRSFDDDHIITSRLEVLRLFFSSQISAADDQTDSGAIFVPLAFTSNNTGHVPSAPFNLGYERNPITRMLNGPPRALAGLISGPATSYFAAGDGPQDAEAFIGSTGGLQILIVGDKDFFDDGAGGSVTENLTFIINAVDYLVGDADLIAVRSREVTTRPLKDLSDGARRIIKWLNTLGPSMLVIAMGLWRWRGNRKRRKYLEDVYAT